INIIFNPIIDRLVKPGVKIYGFKYSPDTKDNTNILDFISQILNGKYIINNLEYIGESSNNQIINSFSMENAEFSFSNRLVKILDNIFSMNNIKDFYGLKSNIETIKFNLNGIDTEINDTVLNYYSDTFKLKSKLRLNNDIGLPFKGELDINGLIVDNYGQFQLGTKNTYINNAKVKDIHTVIYIEDDVITLKTNDNKLKAIVKRLSPEDTSLNILYLDKSSNNNKEPNQLILKGNITNFNPMENLNSIQKSELNLKLLSNIRNIDIISPYIPMVEKIDAVVDSDFDIKGKRLSPKLSGKIEISKGFLKIKDYDEPISNIKTRIRFNRNKNKEQNKFIGYIDYISLFHYNSEIYGKGEFYYSNLFNPTGLSIDITTGPVRSRKGKSLNIDFNSELLKYKGKLSIQRLRLDTNFREFSISGLLIPHSTTITINPLALSQSNVEGNTEDVNPLLTGLVFDNLTVRPGQNVKLEIIGGDIPIVSTISFGDIILNEYNKEIGKYENQVIIKGSISRLSQLKIRGSLNSKFGRINYLNNTFTIDRASVIFKTPEIDDSEDNTQDINLGISTENTMAILILEAKTYKRYVDNTPVRITLDYEGPIEKVVDNLFNSLSGNYYGSGRIGKLEEEELAVLLGLSSEQYESYIDTGITEEDTGETDQGNLQNFQNLALDSVDNLVFQRLLNSMFNSLGLTSSLPISFSIYSSGFRNITSYFITGRLIEDPVDAFVSAFTERLEVLVGIGLPGPNIFNFTLYENLYLQFGMEFKDFLTYEDTSISDSTTDNETVGEDSENIETSKFYLKTKADIDIASGDLWLLNTKLGVSYEPFYSELNIEYSLLFSFKYYDIWFLTTRFDLSYERYLEDLDTDNESIFNYIDLGFSLQYLLYF
ncbi:MAG: hypothetical protein ACOCV8_00590, partial [Spirochaetota bacterium]